MVNKSGQHWPLPRGQAKGPVVLVCTSKAFWFKKLFHQTWTSFLIRGKALHSRVSARAGGAGAELWLELSREHPKGEAQASWFCFAPQAWVCAVAPDSAVGSRVSGSCWGSLALPPISTSFPCHLWPSLFGSNFILNSVKADHRRTENENEMETWEKACFPRRT